MSSGKPPQFQALLCASVSCALPRFYTATPNRAIRILYRDSVPQLYTVAIWRQRNVPPPSGSHPRTLPATRCQYPARCKRPRGREVGRRARGPHFTDSSVMHSRRSAGWGWVRRCSRPSRWNRSVCRGCRSRCWCTLAGDRHSMQISV